MSACANRTGALRLSPAQVVLVVSTVAFSWYAMMALHEAGHVLHALCSGGTVARVFIPVVGFSRTDLAHNPHPPFVVWGGPVWGCILPLILLGLLWYLRPSHAFLARFLAGFCAIANGTYIGVGSFWGVGDAGDMLRLGSPHWLLLAFGVAAVSGGLLLWNGLGRQFGFGEAAGRVDKRAAALMAAAFAIALATVAVFG